MRYILKQVLFIEPVTNFEQLGHLIASKNIRTNLTVIRLRCIKYLNKYIPPFKKNIRSVDVEVIKT